MSTRSTCATTVTFSLALLAAVLTQAAGVTQVTVRDHSRRTIYHSPQTPGYTCWAGIWTMPDASVMIAFTQVTGPLEGWRQRAAGDPETPADCAAGHSRLRYDRFSPGESPPALDGRGRNMGQVQLRSVQFRHERLLRGQRCGSGRRDALASGLGAVLDVLRRASDGLPPTLH